MGLQLKHQKRLIEKKMKLVLCLFMIVAAYCGLSNGAINLYNVHINTQKGYFCDLSRSKFDGKNYYFCITDWYNAGDGVPNGNNGNRPWCNFDSTYGYCH